MSLYSSCSCISTCSECRWIGHGIHGSSGLKRCIVMTGRRSCSMGTIAKIDTTHATGSSGSSYSLTVLFSWCNACETSFTRWIMTVGWFKCTAMVKKSCCRCRMDSGSRIWRWRCGTWRGKVSGTGDSSVWRRRRRRSSCQRWWAWRGGCRWWWWWWSCHWRWVGRGWNAWFSTTWWGTLCVFVAAAGVVATAAGAVVTTIWFVVTNIWLVFCFFIRLTFNSAFSVHLWHRWLARRRRFFVIHKVVVDTVAVVVCVTAVIVVVNDVAFIHITRQFGGWKMRKWGEMGQVIWLWVAIIIVAVAVVIMSWKVVSVSRR